MVRNTATFPIIDPEYADTNATAANADGKDEDDMPLAATTKDELCHREWGYDDRLSKWCAVQRMRCKEVMTSDPKTPMTKAQYQALKDIGFNMDDKRKRYDRAVIDRKWEDKL